MHFELTTALLLVFFASHGAVTIIDMCLKWLRSRDLKTPEALKKLEYPLHFGPVPPYKETPFGMYKISCPVCFRRVQVLSPSLGQEKHTATFQGTTKTAYDYITTIPPHFNQDCIKVEHASQSKRFKGIRRFDDLSGVSYVKMAIAMECEDGHQFDAVYQYNGCDGLVMYFAIDGVRSVAQRLKSTVIPPVMSNAGIDTAFTGTRPARLFNPVQIRQDIKSVIYQFELKDSTGEI